MENDKTHVRRTISISPYIDETIEVLSRSEFGGNASAFIAHSILHYIRCQRCALNNSENDSDNASNMPVQGKSLPRPHWQAPFFFGHPGGGFGHPARVVAVFSVQASTAHFCLLPRKKTFFARRGILKFYRLWTGILSINAYCLGKFL